MLIGKYSISQDLIILLKGDTLNVTIVKNTPENVEVKFRDETLINVINKNTINKIIFNSGRVEICNETKRLPVIKSKEDWGKVVISFDEKDVVGLIEVKTITGKSGFGGMASEHGGEEALKKMKKNAAELGASIILITGGWDKEKNKPISGYARGVKLIGKAYKLK